VKLQGQPICVSPSAFLRSLVYLVCVLFFGVSLGVAQAQNVGQLSSVNKGQDDLSLLTGPISQIPPGGQRVKTATSTSTWPWEVSGETPDPSIRFGSLENGMRYAIQRYDKPEKQVALRFRYEVGSNYEEDHQLGYAHFLEHMAFNGSTNVPEGEFVKRMERLGAAFGRHVNASTSNNETIYQFNLPNADNGRLELALDLFRETADRLYLSQDAIDREKGVISNEEVTRSSPMRDQFLERNKLLYPRLRTTTRDPIGTTRSIETVTSESLRAFYQRWYRPERALLVIVGDIDVDATEALIKERFASWKPALNEPNPPQPSEGQWEDNKLAVFIERSDSAREQFVIESERPDQRLFENGSRDELSVRSLVQTIAFNILNVRLNSVATRSENPPYLSGSYGGPFGGAANARGLGWRAQVDFEPRNGDWRGGMKALAIEMRQVLRDGITQEDRDKAIADFSREYPSMVGDDLFENSQFKAVSLVNTLAFGGTPRAKKDRVTQRAELLRHLEQVTPDRLNEEIRFYWRGVQPRFVITTNDPSVTESSVIRAWREALAAPIPPRQVTRRVTFEPLQMGPAGRLAGRWREPGLDADFVQFENGVTLVVKQNKAQTVGGAQANRRTEVAINVQFGAGWLAFGDSDGIWPSIANAEWERSGFANISRVQLDGAFGDRAIEPISTEFATARTRLTTNVLSTDMNQALDVMLAKTVSPRLGTDFVKTYADRLRPNVLLRQQTAQEVFNQKRSSLYQAGSSLFTARTTEETLQAILNVDSAAGNAKLLRILSDAPISVVLVGDIDLDTAIAAVGARFGALPRRRGIDTGVDAARNWRLREGGGSAQIFLHTGDGDQALVHMAWQIPRVRVGQERFALELLESVFQIQVRDAIRETFGQSYSPSVRAARLPGVGTAMVLTVSAIVLPKDVASVQARIEAIAEDLATHGPTADELDRARAPLLEARREGCKTNQCWVGKISDELTQRTIGERNTLPWRNDEAHQTKLRSMTREEVRDLARRYFVENRLIRVHVLPSSPAREATAN
jgi:zinc protease